MIACQTDLHQYYTLAIVYNCFTTYLGEKSNDDAVSFPPLALHLIWSVHRTNIMSWPLLLSSFRRHSSVSQTIKKLTFSCLVQMFTWRRKKLFPNWRSQCQYCSQEHAEHIGCFFAGNDTNRIHHFKRRPFVGRLSRKPLLGMLNSVYQPCKPESLPTPGAKRPWVRGCLFI